MARQIVCIDDQVEVRDLLKELFADRSTELFAFAEAAPAVAHLREHVAETSLVLIDYDLGPAQPDGLEVIRSLREEHPSLPLIMLTGKGSVDVAVAAVKAGATDFIEKDVYLEDKIDLSVDKIERMLAVVRERDELARTNKTLQQRVESLQRAARSRYQIVGEGPRIKATLEKIVRLAPLPRPVLILGERGTGKELVAHAIHEASERSKEAFVVVNCGAVPETLLESELFGHERGAFTGATQRKLGKFELAHKGTLFLDEIGNMSTEFQIKLLRVLEYQKFQRVAGSRDITVDVRVIAATNADLKKAISEGEFRADLYDRLAFDVIELPPLRERKDDIPVLARHFVERFRDEVGGLRCERLSPEALEKLAEYDFPGNIRELKNVVERAAYAAEGAAVEVGDVRGALPGSSPALGSAEIAVVGGFEAQVDAYQKRILLAALERNDWSQKKAASDLELTYDQFRHMYRKYDLAAAKGQ